MKNLTNLTDVLIYVLKGMYDGERKLQRSMPKFLERISSPMLRDELNRYHENSEKKLNKLERAFEYLDLKPGGRQNTIMGDLLEEIKNLLMHAPNDEVRDAILIGSIQNINHYKISGYGTAHAFCEELRKREVEEILQEILDMEWETDQTLTRLAVDVINERAHETEIG